jgi:AraC-like DNA-binding protein
MACPTVDVLATYTAALPEPASYYAGTPDRSSASPDNVILFSRTSARALYSTRAYHHRFVLVISLHSSGTVIVDDLSFGLRPGMALLIFPHQFHHFMHIAHETPVWLFATFEHSRPEQLQPLRNHPLMIGERGRRFLGELVAGYRAPGTADDGDNGRTVLLTALVLNEMVHTHQTRPRQRVHSPAISEQGRIDEINRYVVSHLGERLDLGSIARHFALSESRLRAVYRDATGLSLGSYITSMRLNRASGLLLNSRLNITHVAYQCGYETIHSFSRAFKRFMGMSPRTYRDSRGRGH